MKRNIKIYLSSTNFREGVDPQCDVLWKSELMKQFNSFSDARYNFQFHDPLQVISDKAEIVLEDINNILSSDFIVCYLPQTKLTIGTIMELQYSSIFKVRDSIILIDRYQIHRNHPWIKQWVKHIVNDECEVVSKLANILRDSIFYNSKEGFLKYE